MSVTKLGLSFHRTFPLSRVTLRQVLATAVERGEVSDDTLREETTLGTEQVHSARRYALGVGLISDKGNAPTSFGRLAYEEDSGFSEPATQWVMHYHLCAPHRHGPAYWNCAVRTCLNPGTALTSADLARILQEKMEEEGAGPQPSHVREAATALLRTYALPEGLGALRILAEDGESGYEVTDPSRPSTAVVAYAIADYWEGVWGEVKAVEMKAINEPGGPTSLLLLNSGEMSEILREMQTTGIVGVYRRVPPYTVVRLWASADDLLARIYE